MASDQSYRQALALNQSKRQFHRQHPLKTTGKFTDWALDGIGYFSVKDLGKQRMLYTRKGAFKRDEAGYLVTAEGYRFEPELKIPTNLMNIYLSESGALRGQDEKQKWVELGAITIAFFEQPQALKQSDAGPAYFEATSASGQAQDAIPANTFLAMTLSGVLEDESQPLTTVPDRGCQQPHGQIASSRALDWVIEGKGYFTFLSPLTGERVYSRQARLYANPHGRLISRHGYFLEPNIMLPLLPGQAPDAAFDHIDSDGTIWVKTSDGTIASLGKINLSIFEHPEKLQPLGFSRETVYRESTDSGEPVDYPVGQAPVGTVKSRFIESCGQDIQTSHEAYLSAGVSGGF